MGFRRPVKLHKLAFDAADGDLDGLEVVMGSLTVGQLMDMTRAADHADRSAEDMEKFFTDFAAALISWNLEDDTLDADGVSLQPVPATLEGVRSCDLGFIVAVAKAWMEAVAGVPGPLPAPSSGGPPSLEGSLPMEPLPPSPAS